MKFLLALASLFLFFFFFDILDAQQNSTVIKQCYGLQCPQNTTYCLKIVNTTADDRDVVSEIDCLDSNFNVTARFNHSGINIFSPMLSFEGVSLSTVHEIPVGTF